MHPLKLTSSGSSHNNRPPATTMHRDDPIAQESLVDRRSLSSSGLIVSQSILIQFSVHRNLIYLLNIPMKGPLKLCNAGSTGAAGDTSPDQSTENPVHLSALEDLSPEFQKHTTCRGISIKNEFLWPQSEVWRSTNSRLWMNKIVIHRRLPTRISLGTTASIPKSTVASHVGATI